MQYDKIILGAGIYGLYSALFCAKQGDRVLVLEKESEAFKRATYVNQARVHMGYHYPRSYSTAIKSAGYFHRFMEDYKFCVLTEFDQVYATSAFYSWTNASQFQKFCSAANIRCDAVDSDKYFKHGLCDGAFITTEYTYDAHILRDYFLHELAKYPSVELHYHTSIKSISKKEDCFAFDLDGIVVSSAFVLNATYSSVNQIHSLMGFEPFEIKYELCEIILCTVSSNLQHTGLTVMDGPFFSIMPFGRTGYHSLTAVSFTPHMTSYEKLPTFACQKNSGGYCNPVQLGNCNCCVAQPESAWPYMSALARKYMSEEYEFEYVTSLFSMKPILKASEIDDSRPTVIRTLSNKPRFISVLSGKINTIYDLDEVLKNEK